MILNRISKVFGYMALTSMAVLGASCGSSDDAILKRDVSRQVTSENETDLRKAKVSVGMSADEVRQVIGNPSESDVERGRKNVDESWLYYELVVHDPPKLRTLVVWFDDGKVVQTNVIN